MTNGDGIPRIPGFSVGWNVQLSNAAIIVGGLSLIAITWLTMSRNRAQAPVMDDETLAKQVETDVFAFAAHPQSVRENRDRIHQAINRIRDVFTAAREAYIKKIRDLHIALKKKLITRAQFEAQREAAKAEFTAAIRARHREIMNELNIPHSAHDHVVTPTLG